MKLNDIIADYNNCENKKDKVYRTFDELINASTSNRCKQSLLGARFELNIQNINIDDDSVYLKCKYIENSKSNDNKEVGSSILINAIGYMVKHGIHITGNTWIINKLLYNKISNISVYKMLLKVQFILETYQSSISRINCIDNSYYGNSIELSVDSKHINNAKISSGVYRLDYLMELLKDDMKILNKLLRTLPSSVDITRLANELEKAYGNSTSVVLIYTAIGMPKFYVLKQTSDGKKLSKLSYIEAICTANNNGINVDKYKYPKVFYDRLFPIWL